MLRSMCVVYMKTQEIEHTQVTTRVCGRFIPVLYKVKAIDYQHARESAHLQHNSRSKKVPPRATSQGVMTTTYAYIKLLLK